MGTFVKHTSCPKCGSRDNLARYEDGSAWCFGCHYWEPRTGEFFNPKVTQHEQHINLPDDLSFDFPRHVVEWLARYDVSVAEAIGHGWQYSPKWDQLTFVWCDEEGKPAFSQARNFRQGAKTKYWNQGSPADILPIFRWVGPAGNPVHQPTLVVVEDAVSAARIARQIDAMPCLGSYLPARKIALLRASYDSMVFWLDEDKLKESREMADMAKWLGITTKVVHTELDPKEYSDEEIKAYVGD